MKRFVLKGPLLCTHGSREAVSFYVPQEEADKLKVGDLAAVEVDQLTIPGRVRSIGPMCVGSPDGPLAGQLFSEVIILLK